jgi:DNA-binding NtrC family response regulator
MKRVLIVEDDLGCDVLLRQVARSVNRDLEIDSVEDAEKAALILAQEHSAGRRYDLVIADIYLAGNLTGVDLWKLHDEFFPFTPLLLTSSATEQSFQEALGSEASPPFLHKPFLFDECRGILRECLLEH